MVRGPWLGSVVGWAAGRWMELADCRINEWYVVSVINLLVVDI